MSLLLQNIIRHIQDKYLKPNHFLMRYDGDNFLALFHFLLICKRCSCLWPVSCSHWNQVHSSCVQIFRIRYNWVSLHKPLNVPAHSQLVLLWIEIRGQPCASPGQGFAHQRVCRLTHGRDSLCFALEHSFESIPSIFAPASHSFSLISVGMESRSVPQGWQRVLHVELLICRRASSARFGSRFHPPFPFCSSSVLLKDMGPDHASSRVRWATTDVCFGK